MVSRAIVGSTVLSFVLTASPAAWSSAAAQGKRQAATQPKPGNALELSLEEVAVMLASPNPDEVRMAMESSVLLGSKDVVPFLVDRVRAGLPPELLDSALDALAALRDPQTAELLTQLSRHRRASVRMRAVRALGALKSPETEGALVGALRDLDPGVREAAADGLGELSGTAHFDVLFTAFERGVAGAGRAVGKQASEAQLGQVLEALGRVPLTAITPVFDALLSRRNLSENAKLRVITALTELGTAEARGYLEGLRQNLPNDAPVRVRRNIDEAVARMAK